MEKEPKYFINLRISILEEYYDLSYAAFNDFPILGIEEKLDELIVCFNKLDYTDELKANLIERLKELVPDAKIIEEMEIKEENWNAEWESSIEPVIISDRIAITPEWKKGETNREIEVIVAPKMSFGTGHHATTRLVSKIMEKQVKSGSFWIDAGCGTGALAIIAIKLGASNAFAFDFDDWSIENSIENFELNGVKDRIELIKADVRTIELPESDGICANLFRNLLIPSFPRFFNSLKEKHGDLIISGVLTLEIEEVIEEAEKAGFKTIERTTEDEWSCVLFKAQ